LSLKNCWPGEPTLAESRTLILQSFAQTKSFNALAKFDPRTSKNWRPLMDLDCRWLKALATEFWPQFNGELINPNRD
jgi:hypothetical protein